MAKVANEVRLVEIACCEGTLSSSFTICEWYSQRLVDFSGYSRDDPAGRLKKVDGAPSGAGVMDIKSMAPSQVGNRMGHEFIGLVEDLSSAVRTVKKGDLVVAPFA